MDIRISLPDGLVQYIESELDSGHYWSPSEGVGAALRLLSGQSIDADIDLAPLKRAWQEGMDSGDFAPLDLNALKIEARERLQATPSDQ